jgi:hypothetical protein
MQAVLLTRSAVNGNAFNQFFSAQHYIKCVFLQIHVCFNSKEFFFDAFCDILHKHAYKLLSIGVFSDDFPGHKMRVHFLTAPGILVIWAVTYPSTKRVQRCFISVPYDKRRLQKLMYTLIH